MFLVQADAFIFLRTTCEGDARLIMSLPSSRSTYLITILFLLACLALLLNRTCFVQTCRINGQTVNVKPSLHGDNSSADQLSSSEDEEPTLTEAEASSSSKIITKRLDTHKESITLPQSTITVPSRIFPVWNRSNIPYVWCQNEKTLRSGILFVKQPKCASSTGSGVTLRIAHTLGRRLFHSDDAKCAARGYLHGWASTGDRNYGFRDETRTMLWTIVRHPASHALSDYFFFIVSRRGVHPTEEGILKYVSHPRFKDFGVNYLKLMSFETKLEEVQHIIQNYDFIALSERMDESLVVLSMILRVPLSDVVVLSSKETGGYDDGHTSSGCVRVKRKWTTPIIDAYMSGEFLHNNSDFILYQAANKSLDRTIDALGRDKADAGVILYRELMSRNEQECRKKAIFPCPVTNRTFRPTIDCYFYDSGCGYQCTDLVLQANSQDEWNILSKGSRIDEPSLKSKQLL